MFSLRNERTAENVSLGVMALVAAAAGLLAAADPATTACVGSALDDTVIAISADACESTAECVISSGFRMPRRFRPSRRAPGSPRT